MTLIDMALVLPVTAKEDAELSEQKTFYPSFITNKTKHFSVKSGCVTWVENGEMRRQL